MINLYVIILTIILLCLQPLGLNSASMQVPKIRTPISKVELARVLNESHKDHFGCYPSKNRLAVAWAQIAIENRQGKDVFNHNLGNINSAKSRPYYILRNRFKSHPNFHAGATDYWKIIVKMCSSSLQFFDAGAAYGAAQQLYRCGYYRADKDAYGKAMMSLYTDAYNNVIPQI